MKISTERLYWFFVALMAVGWAFCLTLEAAPSVFHPLGLLGDVAAWIGELTFPGFTTLLVPGLLLEFILESREAAKMVNHATTIIYVVLIIATALWFWLSRRAPLRLRARVIAVLIIAGPLGMVASIPWVGNYVSFAFLNAIAGNRYYEWKAAQDAAEAGKSPPTAPAPPAARSANTAR